MSASHFDQLPTLALQLALLVERFRRASRARLLDPEDDAAREEASRTLRRAGPLAFAVPALWAGWGEFTVLHARLGLERAQEAPPEQIAEAARRLDDGAEIFVQRCVAWAVRQPHGVRPEISRAFVDWDLARRKSFALTTELEAAERRGESVRDETSERVEASRSQSAQSYRLAESALHGAAAAPEPRTAPEAPADIEQLLDDWRRATDQAAVAELAILEMDMNKLPVEEAQRRRAVELRRIARAIREKVFRAGEI